MDWGTEKGCKFWFLFVTTALIAAAGGSTCITFSFGFHNYHAAMWSLSAAIFSSAALHLNVLNLFRRLGHWHDKQSLTQVKYLAIVVCILSTIGAGVYGALAVLSKEEINFGENSFYLSTTSAGLSFLSGLFLLLTAQWYRSELSQFQRLDDRRAYDSTSNPSVNA